MGFKRDEVAKNAYVANDHNAASFKYKSGLTANTEVDGTKKCTTKIFE